MSILNPTELVSNQIINELKYFLSEKEIGIILDDIRELERSFYNVNDKSYLNILINILIRYRINPGTITDLQNHSYFYLGLGLGLQNEFQIKNVKNADGKEIELIKFNSFPINKDFKNQIPLIQNYFGYLRSIPENLLGIKFDKEQESSEKKFEAVNNESDLFDQNGLFYTYFNLTHQKSKNRFNLPLKVEKQLIIDGIHKCLFYYSAYRSFNEWNSVFVKLFQKELSVEILEDIEKEFQILSWFFEGKSIKSNLFNVITSKKYLKWVLTCNQGDFSYKDKEIAIKIDFNKLLVSKLSFLQEIVNNDIFCKEKVCISPVIEPFINFFLHNNPLNNINGIENHKTIIDYFNKLENYYTFCKLDFNIEKWNLDSNNLLESTIHFLISEKVEQKNELGMPFLHVWEPSDPEFTKEKKFFNYSDSDIILQDFITEYVNKRVKIDNFGKFLTNCQKISELQDKLIKIGDLPVSKKVKFTELNKISSFEKFLTIQQLRGILKIDQEAKVLLNLINHLWYQIIVKHSLFSEEDDFNELFNTFGKQKGFALIQIIENYLDKWPDYQSGSDKLSKLQEEIKTISQLKFDIEGLKLISRKFQGALSFIKAQRLMEKEKNRIIDVILKELVNILASYYYNDGIQVKLDLYDLSMDEEKVIASAIEIVEQVQIFKNQIIAPLEKINTLLVVKTFIKHAKVLLGNNLKIIQLSRYVESFPKWFSKLKEENQLVLVGMNIKNFDTYMRTLFQNINNMNLIITKFYQHSLSKEITDLTKLISETKNIVTLFHNLENLNGKYHDLTLDLSKRLVNLQIISQKIIQINDEIFISYKDLISIDEIKIGFDNSRLKHEKRLDTIIITEVIKDSDSLLVKQLFIEKAFKICFLLDSTFMIISEQLANDFRPVVMGKKYKPIGQTSLDISIDERLEIIMESISNINSFLRSVKLPSRRQVQILKIFVYYTPRLVNRLEINSILKPTIITIIDSTNLIVRKIKSLNLLKELNFHLNTFKRQIFAGYKTYLHNNVFDEKLAEQITNLVKFETDEAIYTRNFLNWIKKIQIILSFKNLNTKETLSIIEERFKEIDIDKFEEVVLKKFIIKDREKLKTKKKKALIPPVKTEGVLKKKVDVLESQIEYLQSQLKTLQEEKQSSIFSNQKIAEVMSSPTLIEEELNKFQKEKSFETTTKLSRLASVEKQINLGKSLESEIFDDDDEDLVRVVVKQVEYDVEDDIKYTDEGDLPAVDLINELRGLRNLDKIKIKSEGLKIDSRARDIITEIEDYLDEEHSSSQLTPAQKISFAYPRPKIKVQTLIDQGNYDVDKISGKYMPGLLPKQLIDSDHKSEELIKHKENIQSLKFALQEAIEESEEESTELESLISDYSNDMFGDLDGNTITQDMQDDKNTKKSNKKSKRNKLDEDHLFNIDYDDLEELED